jgi:hypothetical protein
LTIQRTIISKERFYTDEEEFEMKRRKQWWVNGINDTKQEIEE